MYRKVKSVLNVCARHGLAGVVKAVTWKLSQIVLFARIARSVRAQILNGPLDVATKLADGVAYVYSMAVEGDIAEFGCGAGRSAVALAASVALNNERYRNDIRGTKHLWYFDSFEGLPKARFEIDTKSHHVSTGLWGAGTSRGLDQNRFEKMVARYLDQSQWTVVKGWYKDSVPQLKGSLRFAMLHIDAELYESAVDALTALFARNMISKGAAIYFNGWDCNAADPETGERRAWREVVDRFKIRFSDHGAYGISCHRFVVHGYETDTQ